MIAAPLNDQECLAKLTAVAAQGVARAELRDLAARFGSTDELAAWIRTLPQRDDEGEACDGPRVACDVTQRARLVADDPNCVERAILYIAAAEVIDARPVRQLATVDTRNGRHTFPIEDGDPVALDPRVPRNGLRAGLWMIRNGGACRAEPQPLGDPAPLLEWIADLAEDVAEELDGDRGRQRVEHARQVYRELIARRVITPRQRADALYTLRAAAEAAPLFGEVGATGLRLARTLIARWVAVGTRPAQRNVSPGRLAYWGGKAVATFYGVGGLYDAAYAEVARPRAPPAPPRVRVEVDVEAPPALVLGALDELQRKGG